MVFVHSHYQCPRCKNNIAPCCEGEIYEEPPQPEKKPEEESKEESGEDKQQE
jgi:hypothetical protein